MATNVNNVMVAMEGHLEMKYPEIKQKAVPSVISTKFKDFAKTHNAHFNEKNGS